MTDLTDLRQPDDCPDMATLRQQIDAIDVAMIDLLARRAGYIDRAITLKQIEGLPARTTDRVAEVLDKVGAQAEARGLDAGLARALWGQLIEWSIQREIVELGD